MRPLGLVLAAALCAGCPQAVPAVAPAAGFGACVATDALAGKSLPQMVVDCGGDLVAVIEALLASQDPAVQSSRAYGEAVRLRAAMRR